MSHSSVVAMSLAVAFGASCSRDRSALEKDASGTGGGGGATATAGVTVTATSVGSGGFGGFGTPNGGGDPSTTSGGGGDRPVEPDGPTRIVLVHGVVDRERVGFCFPNTTGEAADVAPLPVGGLAYARAVDVDVDAFPAASDAVVALVAGDEADLEGASCADLLADPGDTPELEVSALGVLPADAIAAPRVLVLAATGCLGGEGHESELEEQICGVGYGPGSPTASLVAASPSRLATPEKVGFQAIGASLAAAPFDVRLRPSLDGVDYLVAPSLSFAAAAPFPPNDDRDLASIGVPSQLATLVTLPGDDDTVLAEIDLGGAAERAGIETFSEGAAYTIVFVGASPGLGDGPWWRGFDALFIPLDGAAASAGPGAAPWGTGARVELGEDLRHASKTRR